MNILPLTKEELETERRKSSQDLKQLEAKRDSLRCVKPNVQDQQVLEEGRYVLYLHKVALFLNCIIIVLFICYSKKLKLYKKLTRIRWDYEALQHSIQGCILFLIYHCK